MRFSIISILFILCFHSCAIPTVKGLSEIKPTKTEFYNPYFSNLNTDYVYKAKINAYDNVFGGILILKKIKEDNHRIVFTTNFGNKIFDFELMNNEIKTHFIIKELDRNVIINTLKRDFKTLTKEHNKINKAFRKNESIIIYQSKTEKRFNHYQTTKQELTKIVNTTNSKEKIVITFDEIQNLIAKNISIQHKSAPIKIDLVYLNN